MFQIRGILALAAYAAIVACDNDISLSNEATPITEQDSQFTQLTVGNLSIDRTRTIRYRIANNLEESGIVGAWIEQNGLTNCQHYYDLNAQSATSIEFTCPAISLSNQYILRFGWAEVDPRANEAARVGIKIE